MVRRANHIGQKRCVCTKGDISNQFVTQFAQSHVQHAEFAVLFGMCRKAFSKTEEVTAEFVLVSKIIHHLIRKDNALMVIETPSRREDEPLDAFNKRQQRERILAVNPNHSPE